MVFLGILLDSRRQVICIPMDKIIKALNWVDFFLNKNNKKVTVLDFQKLCGTLNFICRGIVPGRAFLRWLYINTTLNGNRLKPHNHVRITEENRSIQVIETFGRVFWALRPNGLIYHFSSV